MTNSIARIHTPDQAMQTAQAALDGLAKQQQIIGQNLANIDTPAYRAQTVDFQTALRRAINSGNTMELETTNPAHLTGPDHPAGAAVSFRQGGSLRADGNNVDVDVELTQLSETVLHYQSLTQLVSKKYSLLKTLANGR